MGLIPVEIAMNQVPARRRRSVVSVLVGALAMAGSFAVMGVLVLSDVADARAPRASEPEKVARVDQQQTVAEPTEQLENAPLVEPETAQKPRVVKKSSRKRAKVDFGRFEGY
jgi:Na+/citrate or Na+/malate symporter